MKKRILSLFLCALMLLSTLGCFAGCKKEQAGKKPDALVIMSEELDGLFNPF